MDSNKQKNWDGIPENPEKNGWHWLQLEGFHPQIWYWSSTQSWRFEFGGTPNLEFPWKYLGPCLTPEQVKEIVADAIFEETHPEFGSMWQENAWGYKLLDEQYYQGYKEGRNSM